MEFDKFHQNIYQTGYGFDLPIYKGVKVVQRGQGIGALLGKLFKFALPIVKKHVLPQVTKGVINTVGQVVAEPNLNREKVKRIIRKTSKQTGKKILSDVLNRKRRRQKGAGKRNKKNSKKNKISKKRKIIVLKRKVTQSKKTLKNNQKLRNYIDSLVKQ